MKPATALTLPIPDRTAAGKALALSLRNWHQRDDTIVLALPRGGVPVAYEVAEALALRLDLLVVRKLGVPYQEELAMGAIGSGGVKVFNEELLQRLALDANEINAVIARESRELQRREHAYRGNRPLPVLREQQAILIDDGIATGATMRAAIEVARQQQAAAIIVAAPVASPDTVTELTRLADQVICLFMPELFMAIGNWYDDFTQVSDDTVKTLLQRAWQHEATRSNTNHESM